MAPSEALFNRPPVLIADIICNNRLGSDTNVDNVSEYTLNLWQSAQRVRNDICSNKEVAQSKQKALYDRTVKGLRVYAVGDFVKIKNYRKTAGVCSAFEKKFVGPYRICKKIGELTYMLEAPNAKNETVHYNRLSYYYHRDVVSSPESESLISYKIPDTFHANLDNLTHVVICYKSKLRRRQARLLLGQMAPLVVEDIGISNLYLNSSNSSDIQLNNNVIAVLNQENEDELDAQAREQLMDEARIDDLNSAGHDVSNNDSFLDALNESSLVRRADEAEWKCCPCKFGCVARVINVSPRREN
jgi:hypothetical protein